MNNCKVCITCGKQKLLTSFWAHKATRDGRVSTCIKCKTFKAKREELSHREKIRLYFEEK